MSVAAVALPEGVRVLHIGPHKSGTTALQGALHLSRARLARHGVTYIGRNRQPSAEAQWVTGRPPMLGARRSGEEGWRALVAEVAATGRRRAVISSEFFCEADDATIPRLVSELGGDRVHVVVTLRPLAKILAAQWQQYVQNGTRVAFDDWLGRVFGLSARKRPNPTFWRRHDQGTLVRRWAEVAGTDRLTVIAVDDGDRRMLLRSFENLLGLPEGLLLADDSQANRSLSYGEAEMLRAFNKQFKKRGWREGLYGSHVRNGAVREMKTGYRPAREAEIRTPEWAVQRSVALGEEAAKTIHALGVHVVGDLDRLAEIPHGRVGDNPEPALAPEAGALAVLGAIGAGGDTAGGQEARARRLGEASGRELLQELRARVVSRLRRRLGGGGVAAS